FSQLFQCLSIDQILFLFTCILTEKQILFHSTQYSLLGNIAESLCALLYPFYWQHVYIPLLPHHCIEFISAPVPFIMGVHTSALEMVPFPKDIIRVDLDSKKIHPQQLRGLPKLPERQRTKLKATLQRLL